VDGARSETGAETLPSLLAAVFETKGPDPLAPVTVVTPSGYAAVFVRRALALGAASDGRRGVANVNSTTLAKLVRSLGAPLLATRGLKEASPAVDLEAVRSAALEAGGWLERFASHPRSLVTLERAVCELRRCPAAALESVGSRDPQAAALVMLVDTTRKTLHGQGYADETDVARAALEQARSSLPFEGGPFLTWQLGRCPKLESEVLDRLHARRIEGDTSAESGPPSFTEVRPCADPEEEARTAVRATLEEVEGGVPLWRQAIFHPPRGGYAPLLHHHLERAGLAANGPGVEHLERCAAARSLLGLLELAAGDFARDQVAAWFAAAPVMTGSPGREVPSTRWDALSAAAGVVRGPEQWRERLAHHAATHETDADEAESLSQFVAGLVENTRDPGRSWADHAAWATRLFDTYVEPPATKVLWPEEEIAARSQVRDVLLSISELDAVSAGTDRTTFRFALENILKRTEISDDSGGGRLGDGVFVGAFGAARGLRFEQVVVCGLADALVPGAGGIDPLLRDEVRLFDTSGTLRSRARSREELRDELDCAVAAGASRRVGTLPSCDPRTGRAQYPSRWLRDLAPGDTKWRTVDSFAAAVSGDGPALSATELELRALDRWVGCGGEVRRSPVAAADARLSAGFEAVTSRRSAGFTRFDGLVGAGTVSPFDPETPVSATRFETYAHCPRRYLLERAFRVSRRLLPEDLWKIEPVTRGSLVHAILEDYVAERLDGGQRSLERLLAIAGAHLDEAEESGLVGKRLMWRIDRAAILRELRRFHSEEGDLRPLSVELAFGDADSDSPPVTVALDDGREVHFRGSADRVDRTRSGHLVVSDYKTGKQFGLAALLKDPLANGTLLQLPLYAMAARNRFAGGSPDPVHARYWLLSTERSAPCYHLVVTDEIEEHFRHVVGRIATGVEAGCFPGVPGAATYDGSFENCRHCDFDGLCPPRREREWSRKQSDPKLRPVVDLLHGELPVSLAGAVVKGFVDPDVEDGTELTTAERSGVAGGGRS